MNSFIQNREVHLKDGFNVENGGLQQGLLLIYAQLKFICNVIYVYIYTHTYIIHVGLYITYLTHIKHNIYLCTIIISLQGDHLSKVT